MGRKELGVDESGDNALLDGNPHDAATISDTLALLIRISPVSHGPQRLLDNLCFVKHNSQWYWPHIYDLINRQCTKQCFTSRILYPRLASQECDVCTRLGGGCGVLEGAKTLGCSTKSDSLPLFQMWSTNTS